jgi:hypothetical protein
MRTLVGRVNYESTDIGYHVCAPMSTAKMQAGEEDDSGETFAECQILNPGFYVARPFSATSCVGVSLMP